MKLHEVKHNQFFRFTDKENKRFKHSLYKIVQTGFNWVQFEKVSVTGAIYPLIQIGSDSKYYNLQVELFPKKLNKKSPFQNSLFFHF